MQFTFPKNTKRVQLILQTYCKTLEIVVHKKDFTAPEASLNLPFDHKYQKDVIVKAKKYQLQTLKLVVVIGIGGSNLGAKAIYEALDAHKLYDSNKPKLEFLETISSTTLLSLSKKMIELGNKKTFLIVCISKSGSTMETMANTEALFALLKKPYGSILDRVVAITDKDSAFWNEAQKQKVDCLVIPKMVGGRFSVFSAVGLFPLALFGVNIKNLLAGAQSAVKNGLLIEQNKNHSLASALATYEQIKQGKTIHNSFFFTPELESLGKWERQLIGESLGKEKNTDGKIVHAGITPIVSIGSTDLHSMAQLYFGGPNDKFTNLISVRKTAHAAVPNKRVFPNLVDHLESKTFDELMQAIVGGVTATYKKLKHPFISIELDRVDEKELGYFMQFRMLEIMYLAQLMQVNAFDQPNVELYKTETRKLLNV